MARFVLIDHSIRDLAGHHYEYAVHVLRAAEQEGYEPVLVTNRHFQQAGALPWTVVPQYEFGFWPEPKTTKFHRAAALAFKQVDKLGFRLRCRLRYSVVGWVWLSRSQWQQHLQRRPRGLSELPSYLFRVSLLGALKLLRTLALVVMAPVGLAGLAVWACYCLLKNMLVAPALLFIALGRSFGRILSRPAPPAPLRRSLRALTEEVRTYWEFLNAAWESLKKAREERKHGRAAQSRQQRRQSRAFTRDTRSLLAGLGVAPGDVFYIPTISAWDMLGLGTALAKTPAAAQATWHLLFRRNIYQGRHEEYASQERSLEELRQIFQAFRERAAGVKTYFYTDSEELTDQYNRLGVFEFHTLPIPHTYSPEQRIEHLGPLRITYLGDARREKGFHYLPRVVGDLRAEYLETGRACFAVQCNYNIPGGEAEAVVARTQLESLPEPHVFLYRSALTSEEYKSLLLAADINLLLYEPENYYARSSGILLESLAAGIPVIVPAGTWLARQFLGAYYRHQEGLREQMTLLISHSHTSLTWGRHGQPEVKPRPDRDFQIGFEDKLGCWLEPPAGATHLLVRVEFEHRAGEARLFLTQLDCSESPLEGPRSMLVEAEGERNRGVCLVRLSPGACTLRLAVGSCAKQAVVWLRSLDCDFLRAPEKRPLPSGAVGQIYQHLSEASALVREMIEHYPHYRRTALDFADAVRRRHNPQRLLAELMRVSEVSAASRMVAAAT